MEYVDYKGKKFPFVIDFSTLIAYKEETGNDFIRELSTVFDTMTLLEKYLVITRLGIKTGYDLQKPSLGKRLLNLCLTGSQIGLRKKDYINMVNGTWKTIPKLISKFFLDADEDSQEVVGDITKVKKKS